VRDNPGVTSDMAYYRLLDEEWDPNSKPFAIFDLIRCRHFYSSIEELVAAINKFNEKHKIVLMKDKLNTPLSLVHVNFEY
jgi:hypothetical protein